MRVKVCGVTRVDDAVHAVEHGAWAVGLIFWPQSRRRVRFDEAQAIGATLKRRAEVAGVFVNAPLDEVARTVDACGLTLVQLHGDEGPQYASEVARRTGAKVIKATRVRMAADVAALRPYGTDYHLLDTYREGVPGGTGETFDWELATVRRANPGDPLPRLILSGGLTADNVVDAIHAAWPFAVDVAGGTESSPGRKDPARVEAFLAAVATDNARRRAEKEARRAEQRDGRAPRATGDRGGPAARPSPARPRDAEPAAQAADRPGAPDRIAPDPAGPDATAKDPAGAAAGHDEDAR